MAQRIITGFLGLLTLLMVAGFILSFVLVIAPVGAPIRT
jgi:hypothetical protein